MKKVDFEKIITLINDPLERIYEPTAAAISCKFSKDVGLSLYVFLTGHEEVLKDKWPKGQKPVKALMSALRGVKDDYEKEFKASGETLKYSDATELLENIERISDALELIESLSEEFKEQSVNSILIYEF